MAEYAPLDIPDTPKLTHNITWFARALRKAGLPIGPGRVIDAIRAVQAAGFTEKRDFYWTLHACFVSRPEHRTVFAQVFRLYWRDPRYMEHMMAMMLPAIRGVQEERQAGAGEKRAAEALLDGVEQDVPDLEFEEEGTEIEVDASLTMSAEERLRTLDFEQMSVDEIAAAKRMLARLTLPVQPIPTRRGRPDPLGARADWRRSLRDAMRQGGEIQRLARKSPRIRWPNLIVICDISGSMSQYSRMVLHFLHAVANQKGAGWARVHGFTFGTQLTNISRHLATRDVDAALASAGAEAQDWRHPDRRLPARLQPRLVAPGDGAGRGGVADHRRAGPGRGRCAGPRDAAAAPVGAPSDLAQPVAALGRVRAPGTGHSRDAAACGQFPGRAFDCLARRPGGGDLASR